MKNTRANQEGEPTKICPICGIRKPLSAFLIGMINHAKRYSDICNNCRREGLKSLSKKITKYDQQNEDEDEGGGGKGKNLAVDYFAKRFATEQEQKKQDGLAEEKIAKGRYFTDFLKRGKDNDSSQTNIKKSKAEKSSTKTRTTKTSLSSQISKDKLIDRSIFHHRIYAINGFRYTEDGLKMSSERAPLIVDGRRYTSDGRKIHILSSHEEIFFKHQQDFLNKTPVATNVEKETQKTSTTQEEEDVEQIKQTIKKNL